MHAPGSTPSWAPPYTHLPKALKQSDSKEAGRTPRSLRIAPSLENSTALKGHPGRKGYVFTQS